MEPQQKKPTRRRVAVLVAFAIGAAVGYGSARPWRAPKPAPDLSGELTIRPYDGPPISYRPVWVYVDDQPTFSAGSEVKGRRQVLVKLADGRILIDAAEVDKK